ncbi:MAG: hypothetical protein ACJ770_08240, partial [Gemmatimonadaceae bacterium]
GDAMGAVRLPPSERADVHAWLRERLARECALLDLLATMQPDEVGESGGGGEEGLSKSNGPSSLHASAR